MIEQLNNKFNKITNDRAIHYKILENCIFDILDLFQFKDTNFQYDYKSTQEVILITYTLPKELNGFSEISYRITYAANELRISHNSNYYIKSLNIEDNDVNINAYYEFMIKLNKFIFNIDRELVIKNMIEIKSNQKIINKIDKEIKKLEEEIILIEKNNEFNIIDKVLPNFQTFCIDSFLCNKYNISYLDKPTRKDISKLKKAIIELNQEKTFSFLIKTIKNEFIFFEEKNLIVNNNGTYYLQSTARSKKEINKVLSKQFYMNGEIATKEIFDKSKIFYTLYPEALETKNNKFYYNYQGWGLKLHIEVMKKRLSKLALQKDLQTF
tara:strand:- start:4598 stop:5572 length:975 start_codon:yes stop_codon:yes gene_type:complete